MNKRFASILAIVAIVISVVNSLMWVRQSVGAARLSAASIPQRISYQGRLTDTDGNPLDDIYNMTFRLYDHPTAGTLCWTESQDVTANYGVFTVLLGDITPIESTCFSGSDLYLGVEVGSDGEMTPRRRVVSVGYAYKAETSVDAGTWDGGSTNLDAATGRSSLGLGTMATQNSDDVSIMGGSISGLTDLEVVGGVVPGDGTISQAKLKTATGSVSLGHSGPPWRYSMLTLPGGEYGFFPQIRAYRGCYTTAGPSTRTNAPSIANESHYLVAQCSSTPWVDADTGYQTLLTLGVYLEGYAGASISYAQQRYITASGIDHWIFLLVNRNTGEIQAGYEAPDHPSYGNGGDPNKVPHPFASYHGKDLPPNLEIVLLDKQTTSAIILETERAGESILTLIHQEYRPDLTRTEVYQPLHSGRFLGEEPVLIEDIPAYIKVRRLVRLTAEDKAERELRQQQAAQLFQQEELERENRLDALKQKLGLTDGEFELLGQAFK